jgi:membrane peptidoglycan carboxypeptidase
VRLPKLTLPSIRRLSFPPIPPIPRRLKIVFGVVVAVIAVIVGTWTVRHGWSIYRLNRGVGDTVFYDAAGRPWFRLDEQRRDVPLEQISTYFKDAVIAVEDHRFYLHPGIDPIALTRATFYNLRSDEGTQGGSTITQQLARTLYLSNAKTYGRKAQEAVLAAMLELFLSKREILQLYLNRVYLSGGIYGVETMSRKMFRKPASDLTLGEAALIAGIIRAPASYSPWTHLDAARRRSFVVLQRMREEKKITAAQLQAARAERIQIQPLSSVSSARHGYVKEFLRQQFRDVYGGDNPPDWKVHTTFVPEIQDAAEIAVRDGLRRIGQRDLQAALVAIDPQSGNLLAMVGGSDFSVTPFNRATRSKRQPGSAFKPFVYAAALESGLSPVSTLTGLRQVAVQAPEGVWIPRDERATGQVEQCRGCSAAAARRHSAGAASGRRSRRRRTAGRSLARAWERPGESHRSNRRLCRVSQYGFSRPSARTCVRRERERQPGASGTHRAREDPVGSGVVPDDHDAAGRGVARNRRGGARTGRARTGRR